MSRAFRRLSSPCHFPESNRGLIHTSTQLRRNFGAAAGAWEGRTGLALPPEATNYFFAAGAFGIADGVAGFTAAGGGSGANTFLAESGSLSALATSNPSCHICVSSNMPLKVGIPVSRIPFFTFQ